MKFKIESEIDVDFDKIFSEIPKGLFSKGKDISTTYYAIQCISHIFNFSYVEALQKQIKHSMSKNAAYHEHHDKCNIAITKQLYDNLKITKL